MVYGRGNILEPEKIVQIIESAVAGSSLNQVAHFSGCCSAIAWKYQKLVGLI